MLKFIIDTQLPPLLAELLRYKGYDATHTSDYPDGIFMTDNQIVEYAEKENRIIVSKDADFFHLVMLSHKNIKVILIELGNIKNKLLLEKISESLNIIIEQFEDGASLVIVQNDNLITY